MPVSPTYPGVYIEEVPSEVRTITGVATSITAFIGRAPRGELDSPVKVRSFAEYARTFGGLSRDSTMSYAVQQYFANGGAEALIIRVFNPDGATVATSSTTIELDAEGATQTFTLIAANPGSWADNLNISVNYNTRDTTDTTLFNLIVEEIDEGVTRATETFLNVSSDSGDPRYVVTVLEQESDLVREAGAATVFRPDEVTQARHTDGGTAGDDRAPVGFDEIGDEATLSPLRQGIWALDDADIFNMMCIPPFTFATDVDEPTWTAAQVYCKDRRAMLIIDPPSSWNDPSDVLDGTSGIDGSSAPVPVRDENAAIYFPRVRLADAEQQNRLATFAPCGIVAGIYARTDSTRGIWKAPAGQEAQMVGVRELTYNMTDGENGDLNPRGVNCLRKFPVAGNVVWGGRTTEGADQLASEWKYIPVRRMALYIEESLYRGTQWVIFEPNDEPLWAQIRLNVGAFMQNLFRQGAFQGSTARDAYFVKCDRETTTQNDINQGIVNLLVGFAPLKPAEFLIIKISQIAGDIQT